MKANVSSSDAGIASQSPEAPIANGNKMNPGTIKIIPLISI